MERTEPDAGEGFTWEPQRRKPPFVIQDPMLGYVRPTEVERHVIDSDIFQRQRGIKQMGTSHLIYPSGVQNRFVHALGNLTIIGRMFSKALENSDPAVEEEFLRLCQDWLPELGRLDPQPVRDFV